MPCSVGQNYNYVSPLYLSFYIFRITLKFQTWSFDENVVKNLNFAQKKSLRNCGGEESRRSLIMDEVRTDGQGTFLNNKLDC